MVLLTYIGDYGKLMKIVSSWIPSLMQDTRREILKLMRSTEIATVKTIAESLELSVPTVRHHMAILERDGLVLRSIERGKIGKPPIIYSLSLKGEESFPKKYDRLSSALIEQAKFKDGQDAVLDLMRDIAQRKVHKRDAAPDRLAREDQIDLMLAIMEEEGFEPQLDFQAKQVEIRHHTCPYQAVALEHPEVCELDVQIIQCCLGGTIERTAWRPDGDRVCVFITSIKQESSLNL